MFRERVIKNKNYIVNFTGKKEEFNKFIFFASKLSSYNLKEEGWEITHSNLSQLKKALNIKLIANDMLLRPYQYQEEAIKTIVDKQEMLLVLPCGSGKTAVGIGAYLEAKDRGLIKGPGLVIVKASLKVQWAKEVRKFSNLTCNIIKTSSDFNTKLNKEIKLLLEEENLESSKKANALTLEKNNRMMTQFEGYDLLICNYETLNDKSVRECIRKIKCDFAFADEIHYVKSRTAKRSKSLYELKDIKFKIGATATPVGKSPEDLFGIFSFIKPNIFESWSKFSKRYIKFAGYGKIIGFLNLNELREKISNNILVKTKEEISSQLPSLVVMQRYCDFTSKQIEANNSIMEELENLKAQEKALSFKFKSQQEKENNSEAAKLEALILAHQTFAQQLANTEELLRESESEISKKFITGSKSDKMETFLDLLEEIISSGEKVAVFSKYKRMQPIITKEINEKYKDIKIAYINGDLSSKERYEEAYDKFRDNDDYKVLLMSDAGCEGINLSNCKYLIEFDLADSYAIQTQRHGRLERADSIHDNVFVYQLITNNSWDEIAAKIIEKKESYDIQLIN